MDYFYEPILSPGDKSITLKGVEAAHIMKVLRYKEGMALTLLDGRGGIYEGLISGIAPDGLEVKITGQNIKQPYAFNLHIALGLLKKNGRMEWFIEKAVEIGVSEISIFYAAHSEKRKFNMDRVQKVAVAALKQSGNPWLPRINEPIGFEKLIKMPFSGEKYIGYCTNEKEMHLARAYTKGAGAFILIGPEGDFTKEEVTLAENAGFAKISLGENRLRAETAALAALMIIDTINNR